MSQEIYRRIAKEIEDSKTDSALWTQAFAECDGDADKTKALYIRLRYADLAASVEPTAASAEPTIPKPLRPPPASPPITELDRLRARLKATLAETGKQSFYQLLGLDPDVDDAVIAATIAKLKARVAQGEILASEVGYAIDALGTPQGREKYDRRLLGLLAPAEIREPEPVRSMVVESSVVDGWWKTGFGKVVVFMGTVLLVAVAFGVLRQLRAPKAPPPRLAPAAADTSGQYAAQREADRREEQQSRDESAAARMAAQQNSAVAAQSSCQQEVARYREAVSQARTNRSNAITNARASNPLIEKSGGFAAVAEIGRQGQKVVDATESYDMAVKDAERNYAMARESCQR